MKTMKTMKTDTKTPNWENEEWYNEWLQLAKKDYHGKRCGRWICYYNEKNELIYKYVDM